MLKNAVAILDIGSSKVTAVIGERAVNNNFVIRAEVQREHDALYDGEVCDKDALYDAVTSAIKAVSQSAKVNINEIYVGVPGDFLLIRNKQNQITLNKKRKIKQKDVDELYDSIKGTIPTDGYEIIDRSAVYYFVNGNQRVAEPIGISSEFLMGYLTFFLCKSDFTATLRDILSDLKIKNITFIPTPQAQSLFLFSRQERYAYVILADVGYISTSISIILGDGMLYQGAFPLGGGHITAYLNDGLKIEEDSISIAEMLKRKINLSYGSDMSSIYEIYIGDERYTFNVSVCNEIVKGILDGIAEHIDNQLTASRVKLPHGNNISLSLTGGGISFMRGAKEYLSKRIEMGINIVSSNIPFMNKPDESSKLSLLDYALRLNNRK